MRRRVRLVEAINKLFVVRAPEENVDVNIQSPRVFRHRPIEPKS